MQKDITQNNIFLFLFTIWHSNPVQPGQNILVRLCGRNVKQHRRCDGAVNGDEDTRTCLHRTPLHMQICHDGKSIQKKFCPFTCAEFILLKVSCLWYSNYPETSRLYSNIRAWSLKFKTFFCLQILIEQHWALIEQNSLVLIVWGGSCLLNWDKNSLKNYQFNPCNFIILFLNFSWATLSSYWRARTKISWEVETPISFNVISRNLSYCSPWTVTRSKNSLPTPMNLPTPLTSKEVQFL